MTLPRLLESWAEGLLRIVIGIGLAWIGVVEGAGYGAFLEVVGAICIAAGIGEIWSVEFAAHGLRREASMSDIHPALVTCDVPVFYATREGHTRRVAERLVAVFRDRGFTSRAIDVASADADYVDWGRVRAAVVGASLHAHRHQRSADAFVRQHGGDLNGHPSAFFSVSLSAASARPEERAAAAQLAQAFPAACGWHADETVCVAGRLAYTRYGVLTRFIMKRIARREGAPTDTSRDHEFTNWDEVARLADSVARRIAADRAPRAA
jgi:menaquinone-dependent protoporphyrinogen oxidase